MPDREEELRDRAEYTLRIHQPELKEALQILQHLRDTIVLSADGMGIIIASTDEAYFPLDQAICAVKDLLDVVK